MTERHLAREEKVQLSQDVSILEDFELCDGEAYADQKDVQEALDDGYRKVRNLVDETNELLQALFRLEQALPYWDDQGDHP